MLSYADKFRDDQSCFYSTLGAVQQPVCACVCERECICKQKHLLSGRQDDWYDSESDMELPPWPSNQLNAPLWNSVYPTGGCGKWQKLYTKFHRGMCSRTNNGCVYQPLCSVCVCLCVVNSPINHHFSKV